MPRKDKEDIPPFEPREEGGFVFLRVSVDDIHGLHARPSATFLEKVLLPNEGKVDVAFQINGDGTYVPIRSVFDLLGLGLNYGTKLVVRLAYRDKGMDEQARRNKCLAIARTVHKIFFDMQAENGPPGQAGAAVRAGTEDGEPGT